jgi:hypothetical protein
LRITCRLFEGMSVFPLQSELDPTGLDRTVIVLTGKLDADDVAAADQYVEEIKQKYGAFVSIIGIQDSVDEKLLDQLADYSAVIDLNKPLPSNVQDIIEKAHGCHA